MSLPPPVVSADALGPAMETPPPAFDPIAGYGQRPEASGEQAGLPIGPDEVTAGLVAVGDILAQLRGEHWRIEPGETALIAPPLARQLSKPDSAFAAWLAAHTDAALITVGAITITVPRLMIEYRVLRARRAAAELERQSLSQQQVPLYGYEPGPEYAGGADRSAYGDARPGVPATGDGEAAVARPTDPGRLADAVASIIGS